jgi:hypothetical protein
LVDQIPSASWHWDTYLEGTHIVLEAVTSRVWTFTANAAITAGYGVELATGSVVNPISDNSLVGIGVATETAASGAHVPVAINSLVRGVTASGAITAGQRVQGAGSGQFKSWYVTSTRADSIMGVAITAASAGGTFILYVDAS